MTGILKVIVIRRTGIVEGADWHGKATTVLLYITIFLHLAWYDIPDGWSIALTALCTGMMLLSFVLYGIRNLRLLKNAGKTT